MRLNRLDLTRYGRFTDQSLNFPAPQPGGPDLHIIYGPNEAGKSTLFSAWLDFLFGIPTRTRYDFQHAGNMMMIGAEILGPNGPQTLRRIKRASGSLRDAYDSLLPETTLQSFLGGLTRDSYSSMFSLDDDTIEKGGEGILASRGDLGEMLFSASAGLSDLTAKLEQLRGELDGFYPASKSSIRSGWLHDAKKKLTSLDEQRRSLDITAATLQKLSRDAEASEAAWKAARAEEARLQTLVSQLTELAATYPLSAKLADLTARLAPYGDLPDAPTGLEAEFSSLNDAAKTVASHQRERKTRLAALQTQRQALVSDSPVLSASAAIQEADQYRAEHDSALADLPRRRGEAQTARDQIRSTLTLLGQDGRDPNELILPNEIMAQLRHLLTQRSGIEAAQNAAVAEAAKAQEQIAREESRTAALTKGADTATISALLARLRAHDPAEALARAEREEDSAKLALTRALDALAPWAGDIAALTATHVPNQRSFDDWQNQKDQLDARAQDIGLQITALKAELEKSRANLIAAQAKPSGLSLSEGAAARSRREALWSLHIQTLSPASAQAFEQALREDDRISALMGEALAAARDEAAALAEESRLSAQLSAAAAQSAAISAEKSSLNSQIQAASKGLLPDTASLEDLRDWASARSHALELGHSYREAAAATARAKSALDGACSDLTAALGVERAPYETLRAQASARSEAGRIWQDAHERLAQLQADLKLRNGAVEAALHAYALWHQEWKKAAENTIIANYDPQDQAIGPALDLLGRLAAEFTQAQSLEYRITRMEENVARFCKLRDTIMAGLDLGLGADWALLQGRLRQAQDDRREAETLDRQILEDSRIIHAEDQRALQIEASLADLGQKLGLKAGQGDLGDFVELTLNITRQRRELRELKDSLAGKPLPTEDQSEAGLRADLALAGDQLAQQRSISETAHAAYLQAWGKLQAVGGDDQLARLQSQRENLLLEMGEKTRDHLSLRFGLMAVEAGLRRYRDQHRSAMLLRASEAFKALSLGAYTGLTAQPDGAQDLLVALSASGAAKRAVDMSKGTRFQLYLALRIAGYHEMAKSRPSVPFIADDIMETFDDGRSAEAFKLLADMSKTGQVIYLTHHQHLCDIARAAAPGVTITELHRSN